MPAAIPIEINHGASGLIVSNHGAPTAACLGRHDALKFALLSSTISRARPLCHVVLGSRNRPALARESPVQRGNSRRKPHDAASVAMLLLIAIQGAEN